MLNKTLNKAYIKEIFQSIQGEGLYIGVNQLFIRFSRCNLSCSFCDTDFKSDLTEYSVKELLEEVQKYNKIHSISLTGGEPLMEIDFLKEFLPHTEHKIYLETNGILHENLKQLIDYIDIIAMDFKLPSCTKNRDFFNEHEKFIQAAEGKNISAKIVFDENITDSEINKCLHLGRKYSLPLILQPKMNGNNPCADIEFMNKTLRRFALELPDIRLIPQVHKFINAR